MSSDISAEDLAALNRLRSAKDTVPWWHRLHRWTQWECRQAEVVSTAWTVGGTRVMQTRRCVHCNLMQVRSLRDES